MAPQRGLLLNPWNLWIHYITWQRELRFLISWLISILSPCHSQCNQVLTITQWPGPHYFLILILTLYHFPPHVHLTPLQLPCCSHSLILFPQLNTGLTSSLHSLWHTQKCMEFTKKFSFFFCGHKARQHFPASFAVKSKHVTEFWPMGWRDACFFQTGP